MYLPDTNIFIRGIKRGTPESKFLTKVISGGKLFISVVVVGEFLAKADKNARKKFISLMSVFKILSIDKEVAQVAAEYRKQILQKSKRILLLDCFLAAQARLNNLILVTNNKADFPMKDIKVVSP